MDKMHITFSRYFLACIMLVCSTHAAAGFREALSALQHRDAEKMVVEVETAVREGDYDGAYLLTGTLYDNYKSGKFLSVKNKEELAKRKPKRRYDNVKALIVPHSDAWVGFMSKGQRLRLAKSLKKLPIPSDRNISSLNHALLMNLQGEGKRPASYEYPFKGFLDKAGLVYVRLNINPTDYELGESDEFKKYKYEQALPVDKPLGYKLLEELLLEQDDYPLTYLRRGDLACIMANAYLTGDGGYEKDFQQAALWYKRAYSRGYYSSGKDCDTKGLLALQKLGELSKYDRDLATKIAEINGEFPKAYKVRNFNLPDLIVQHRKRNLKLPIISLVVTYPFYSIDVFAGGIVRYKTVHQLQYSRDALGLLVQKKFPKNAAMGFDEWKASPKTVKKLLAELKRLNLAEHTGEACLCDVGEAQTETILTIRGDNNEQIMSFQSWGLRQGMEVYYDAERTVSDEEAAMLSVVEKYIPTRGLRCGEDVKNSDYKQCMADEQAIEKKGAAWIKDQRAKKQP